MTAPIQLEVIGIPAPQGSKTRMPNGAMVDGGSSKTGRAKLTDWRKAVADAARAHLEAHTGQATITGPVDLDIAFRFPATKSNPHRCRHVSAPDVDKLARSTCDALVAGGLLADDRLVCDLSVSKRWCPPEVRPGASIRILDMTVEEDELVALRRATDRDRRAAERRAAKAAS